MALPNLAYNVTFKSFICFSQSSAETESVDTWVSMKAKSFWSRLRARDWVRCRKASPTLYLGLVRQENVKVNQLGLTIQRRLHLLLIPARLKGRPELPSLAG
jgi:hypothetical protein